MGTRIVKNYPSPRLMETIGATNQSTAEAIGELVANCFDARLGDEKMIIVIDMRAGMIKVIDNGRGMTSDVLEKAVCIAEDMSRHIERGKGAKGHFGMGFKTSCSTLGRRYEIFTRPAGGSEELHVAFDIRDYARRPSGADAWDVVIEDKVADGTGPLAKAQHGTAFVVSDLKDRNPYLSAVLDYLGKAFKGHLETGDRIVLLDANGAHEVIPAAYSFVKGSRVSINTTCGPNDAYAITGWMAIDRWTHNDGLYGFNIYRNGQLIESWNKDWFRAHLMTSRIIGEVNMDFLDATFYKQGVQQAEPWLIAKEHMKEYLRPLVKASNVLSRQGNIHKAPVVKKTIAELREAYDEEPYAPGPAADDGPEDGPEDKSGEGRQRRDGRADKPERPSVNETVKTVVQERSLVLSDEGEIEITYAVKASSGNVNAPFDYIFDEADDEGEAGELQVILFEDHPLWKRRVDANTQQILATSDAIYRMLVEKLGFDSSQALKIRNSWVWKRATGEKE